MFQGFRGAGREHESDRGPGARRLNRESLSIFGRVLGYVKPYTSRMVVSVIALIFSTILGLVLPLVVRSLVDVVLIDKNFRLLNQIALGLMVVFIAQAIFSFIHRLSLAYVGERVVANIRIAIYSHLQHLSLQYFTDHRTGEIVSRLTNDVSLLQEAVTNSLVSLLRQLLTLIGGLIFLFVLDWRLTLIILIGIPLVTLTMVALGRQIRTASKMVQDQLAEAANVIEETTSGVRIVKSFAREAYEISRFSEKIEATFQAAMRRARVASVLGPFIGFMAFASITITLWFGSFEVIQGRLTAGGLVAYLVYTMMVAAPIASLAGLYTQFQNALGAVERLFSLLDTVPDIDDHPQAITLPSVAGNVTFDAVHFHYNTKVPVLKSIFFSAKPGQVIALVGPSGAGKTTVINLIPRFYEVTGGCITIDGYDIRDVTLASLRGQIGIVPQDPLLFSETVLANIRYGRLDAGQAEVEAAAKAANAHEFIINELPDGYQTLVGERGVKLSGGQRQRVAIARAILKDPRILILDEATSSLDSESEQLVQEALEHLMRGRTTFVIAHRLSTIVNADWIIVLAEGKVVEQGTHADLLAHPDGLYYRLYNMQFSLEAGPVGL